MAKRDERDEDLIEEDEAVDEVEDDMEEEEEYEEDEDGDYDDRRRLRLIPALVLTGVMVAFGSLAWHSYRSGIDSVKDSDVLLVEADKTPLKEKPADPGGMKFPHQDKTVFDTISSNPPKAAPVERVLPASEQPADIAAVAPASPSEAKPWGNDKLQESAQNQSVSPSTQQANIMTNREAIALGEKSPSAGGPAPVANTGDNQTASENTSAPAAAQPAAEAGKPVEIKEVPVKTSAIQEKPKAAHVAEAPKKPAAEKKPAPATVAKVAEKKAEAIKASPSAGGTGVIQLGAYHSEEEAKKEWAKLSKKYSNVLSDKTVYYVRADLGSKGVFYRLRASGFKDAKATCAELTPKGQACMPVNGK